MKYPVLLVCTIFSISACASAPVAGPDTPRASAPGVAGSPARSDAGAQSAHRSELTRLLGAESMDGAALAAFEQKVGGVFFDLVGEVAEDEAAALLARVHALELIAMQDEVRQYDAVRAALHAKDARVRATALATANSFVEHGHGSAKALLREALEDPAPEIQAKALQFVGEEDIALLRRIATSDRAATVLSVANGLLQALEERGAPLAPDAAGVLTRTNAAGHAVRFAPVTTWKEWNAAVGRVTIRTADKRTISIPGEVEVVENVVPVFFSSDGAHAVYEAGRRIHVMDLATGVSREVGPGIAPRIRPFTNAFVFLRADPTGPVADRGTTRLSYNILSAPFAGGEPTVLGSMDVTMSQSDRGNYSPARWMSVEETDGTFHLAIGGNVLFRLPDPFATPGA